MKENFDTIDLILISIEEKNMPHFKKLITRKKNLEKKVKHK
jgi:hypothetical protein